MIPLSQSLIYMYFYQYKPKDDPTEAELLILFSAWSLSLSLSQSVQFPIGPMPSALPYSLPLLLLSMHIYEEYIYIYIYQSFFLTIYIIIYPRHCPLFHLQCILDCRAKRALTMELDGKLCMKVIQDVIFCGKHSSLHVYWLSLRQRVDDWLHSWYI